MTTAKLFQAMGIACVIIGLVQGIYGDMWGELYLLLAGIGVFFIGRLIEKRQEKQRTASQSSQPPP